MASTDAYIGVPVVIGAKGVERIVEIYARRRGKGDVRQIGGLRERVDRRLQGDQSRARNEGAVAVTERYALSVVYAPSTLCWRRRGLHLWRSLTSGWRLFASIAMVAVVFWAINFLVFGPLYGRPAAPSLGAAEIGLPDRLLVVCAQRSGAMRASWVGRLKSPQARFVVSDAGVEVATDANSGRLRWDAVKQIWKFQRLWLLDARPDALRHSCLWPAPRPRRCNVLNANVRPRPL